MIWFFTRGSAQIDFEVRRITDPDGYELVVDYSDGSENIERFTNPRRLVDRSLTLQRRLIGDGWMPSGPGMYGVSRQGAPAGQNSEGAGPPVGLPASPGEPADRRHVRAVGGRSSSSQNFPVRNTSVRIKARYAPVFLPVEGASALHGSPVHPAAERPCFT
jgi:hypothetical protein